MSSAYHLQQTEAHGEGKVDDAVAEQHPTIRSKLSCRPVQDQKNEYGVERQTQCGSDSFYDCKAAIQARPSRGHRYDGATAPSR